MAYSAFPKTGAKATFNEISYSADFHDTDYQTSNFENISPSIKISNFQQFYVRFKNVGIGGSPGNIVPSIGIAIIGVNNYIL